MSTDSHGLPILCKFICDPAVCIFIYEIPLTEEAGSPRAPYALVLGHEINYAGTGEGEGARMRLAPEG